MKPVDLLCKAIEFGKSAGKLTATQSITYGIKYSRVDQLKFFKGCLPQIFLGPLLNTSHLLSEM